MYGPLSCSSVKRSRLNGTWWLLCPPIVELLMRCIPTCFAGGISSKSRLSVFISLFIRPPFPKLLVTDIWLNGTNALLMLICFCFISYGWWKKRFAPSAPCPLNEIPYRILKHHQNLLTMNQKSSPSHSTHNLQTSYILLNVSWASFVPCLHCVEACQRTLLHICFCKFIAHNVLLPPCALFHPAPLPKWASRWCK